MSHYLTTTHTDGKEYDPSDFDFVKVDEEEKKRDAQLAAQTGGVAQSYYDITPPGYPLLTSLANNYPGQPMVGVDSIHQATQGGESCKKYINVFLLKIGFSTKK